MSVNVYFAAGIAGEGCLFDSPVHSRLFERLDRRRLGVCESRLGAALREGPSSATGLDQQKLNAAAALPVADRGYLFAPPQLMQMGAAG